MGPSLIVVAAQALPGMRNALLEREEEGQQDSPTKEKAQEMTTATRHAADIKVEDVGPDEALKMLEKMPRNRRLNWPNRQRYAREMQNGTWREYECTPLRFDSDGNLLDGQHRLWAVIDSGTTQRFVVIRGLPNEALDVIDTGRSRSLTDILHIRGESNASELTSAINLLSAWENSDPKMLARDAIAPGARLTVAEALAFLEAHPELREAVVKGNSIRRKLAGGGGRWAAVWHILSGIDGEDAEFFFSRLSSGEELAGTSPILLLRKRLIDDMTNEGRLSEREYTAVIFKAWNYYREGRSAQVLSWRAGGANPEPYPEPK